MVRAPASSEPSGRPRRRSLKRALGLTALLAIVLLALSALSAGLIVWQGTERAVRTAREIMLLVRPFALGGQVLVIALMWWFWVPLVRRFKLPPAAEQTWLAARHRLTLWAIVLVSVCAVLWFPR